MPKFDVQFCRSLGLACSRFSVVGDERKKEGERDTNLLLVLFLLVSNYLEPGTGWIHEGLPRRGR